MESSKTNGRCDSRIGRYIWIIMNIQEAYNKGLSDAENQVIDIFRKALLEQEHDQFANPEMNKLLEVMKRRSDYYRRLGIRNNNIGKTFRKLIKEEHDILGVEAPIPEAVVKTKDGNLEQKYSRNKKYKNRLERSENLDNGEV